MRMRSEAEIGESEHTRNPKKNMYRAFLPLSSKGCVLYALHTKQCSPSKALMMMVLFCFLFYHL